MPVLYFSFFLIIFYDEFRSEMNIEVPEVFPRKPIENPIKWLLV